MFFKCFAQTIIMSHVLKAPLPFLPFPPQLRHNSSNHVVSDGAFV